MVKILNGQLNQYTNEQLSRYTNRQLALMNYLGYIYDRTEADVKRWRELRDKGWEGMTEDERQEWLGVTIPTPAASKGMYTHNDLNRVESTVEFLAIYFKEIGYPVPDMTFKFDWSYKDNITRDEMDRYFSNVNTIRNVLRVFPDTPKAPTIYEKFDYSKANDVEKIVEDTISVVNNLTDAWRYADEFICGEV